MDNIFGMPPIAFVLLLALGTVVFIFWKRILRLAENVRAVAVQRDNLDKELEKYRPIIEVEAALNKLKGELAKSQADLDGLIQLFAEYDLKVDLVETGFYQPKFHLDNVLDFIEALDFVREAEREVIRKKEALLGVGNKELGKLALSAFNGDSTPIIEDVTYSNFEKSKEKLRLAFNKVNNLLVESHVQVAPVLLDLKLKELALVYGLKEAEQKAKEEQTSLKEQMREEEAARVEAERARLKAIKEQENYEAALVQGHATVLGVTSARA